MSERKNKDIEAVFVLESLSVLEPAPPGAHRHRPPLLLGLMAVKVFQRFQLLDQGLVLVLQHGHAVLQTPDVLFLFPAAFSSCLPEEGANALAH